MIEPSSSNGANWRTRTSSAGRRGEAQRTRATRANAGRHTPQRRKARRRSTVLIILAIVVPQVLLAGVLAVGLGVLPGRDRAASTANADARAANEPLRAGDCVRTVPGQTDQYVWISCQDHRSYGQVLGVVDGPATATEACDPASDFFATQPGQVVCLRQTGDEHPGDPGKGGGVYRAGDCVATDLTKGVTEVPCDDPTVFETISARVATVSECVSPAIRYATVQHGAKKILCLGPGPGIAEVGDCIGDPERAPVSFDKIPCGDRAARAKLLARVATPVQCQAIAGQTHYVTDPNGLPKTLTVCLRKLV